MGDNEFVYEEVGEPDRQAYLRARQRGDSERLTQELLALTFHDPDWRWVQDECLSLLADDASDEQSRYIAVLCLGHLATFQPATDYARVLPAVVAHQDDPSARVRGRVGTFLDDIADAVSIMDYLPIGEADRDALAAARDRRDVHAIDASLLALAKQDPDDQWVEARCVECLYDTEPEVRRVAVLCLRDMVSDQRRLDYPRLLPAIRAVRDTNDGVRQALDAFAESLGYAVGVDGYTPWTAPDRHTLARAHAEGDHAAVTTQLAGLALEDPDWRWVQGACLDLLHATDPGVRVDAVECLTILLFLRRQLDRDTVTGALRSLRDPEIARAVDEFYAVLEEVKEQEEPPEDQRNGTILGR